MKKEKKVNAGSVIKKILASDKYGALLIVVLMSIIMIFLSDSFLTKNNLMNLLRQASFYVMIACGMLIVFMSGEIDLSQGSIMCICGIVAAKMAHEGINVLVIIVAAVAVGAVVGALNGWLIGYVGMPAFIVTLGMQMAVKGIVLIITGGYPVNNLEESFNKLGTAYILGIPAPIYFMVGICLLTWFILSKTKLGRHIVATGGNVQAAIVSGINTKKQKLLAFVIDGTFCAIAGVVLCARFSSGQLALGAGYEMYSIAGCVIGGVSMAGGVGTVLGTFFGTLVMSIMRNGMDLVSVNAYWQQFAQGAIIILAVLLDVFRRKMRNS